MAKAELMATLWPDTCQEANLTQHVYTLRKALGDQPTGSPYLETVPRRGYRIAAEVREGPGVARPGPETRRRRLTPPAIAAPAPASRRRAQTGDVIQCGIADAGAIAEGLGPVAMRRLSRNSTRSRRKKSRDLTASSRRTQPDGFVAIFGARAVHEDDPRRAILAARRVERRVRGLAPPTSPDEERLPVQSGLTTGPLVISRVTDGDPSSTSPSATRCEPPTLLPQLAEPGSILISEATRRAVEENGRGAEGRSRAHGRLSRGWAAGRGAPVRGGRDAGDVRRARAPGVAARRTRRGARGGPA